MSSEQVIVSNYIYMRNIHIKIESYRIESSKKMAYAVKANDEFNILYDGWEWRA